MDKYKKSYRVNFDTKKGGFCSWVIDIDANTAKKAKEIAMTKWEEFNNGYHMFHITVRRLNDIEEFLYNWFAPVPTQYMV